MVGGETFILLKGEILLTLLLSSSGNLTPMFLGNTAEDKDVPEWRGNSYGEVSGKEPTLGTSLNVVSILSQEYAPRGA